MVGFDGLPRLIDFGESTPADPLRIRNDNERLEALFHEDLDVMNRRRKQKRERSASLTMTPTSPGPSVRRMAFDFNDL